jgi:hypothetical protein
MGLGIVGSEVSDWQFLCLAGTDLTLDQIRLYLDNVGGFLAALQAAIPPVGKER